MNHVRWFISIHDHDRSKRRMKKKLKKISSLQSRSMRVRTVSGRGRRDAAMGVEWRRGRDFVCMYVCMVASLKD